MMPRIERKKAVAAQAAVAPQNLAGRFADAAKAGTAGHGHFFKAVSNSPIVYSKFTSTYVISIAHLTYLLDSS